jgi:hypothetical protein
MAMRASHVALGLSFLLVICVSAAAQPQSLADAARKAEEARKAVKAPGKVYTNDDLKRFGGAPPPPVAAGEAGQAAPPAVAAQSPQAGQPAQPGPEASAQNPPERQPVKDEAWWRKTLAEVRGKLERSKAAVEALDSQIYAMQVDFYSRDEVSEREPIGKQIEKAMGERDTKYREMEEAAARLAELEEEARRTHVLPGWIR